MSEIDERNRQRKKAVYELLQHKTLGIMLGLSIVFLGLSVWSYLFIVLFLFCFMEWHDMGGYKFSASEPDVINGVLEPPLSDKYHERNVINVMHYKMDNAVTGAILLIFALALTYFWYDSHTVIYVLIMTLLWYFSGVKEVFFYDPFDENFLTNPNIWWYIFTFYGFYQYKIKKWFGKEGTMSGKDAIRQAFIGIGISIIFTIIWNINFIKELL